MLLSPLCLQKALLRELFHKHKDRKKGCLGRIAEEFPGGFGKSQISSHLRKMGLQLRKKGGDQQASPTCGQMSPALCSGML